MISKKYQALKLKKRGFCPFLAFGTIFGGLLIISGGKMAIFEYRAMFPNNSS